jgi:hypothetical protein
MFFELVTADVVIADVSVLNANAFYELGVRHGVAPRGVLMIHGGCAKPAFDLASDRRFEYDGKLFLLEAREPKDEWDKKLNAEAEKLGQTLRRALGTDAGVAVRAGARAPSPRAAMAERSLRRWPTEVTPMAIRSSAVRSGSTSPSTSLSRNAGSY